MDELDEGVVSVQQRQRRGMVIRRNQPKMQRAKKIARKRLAPDDKIKKRAYALARRAVRKRFAGRQGADYDQLSPSQKVSVDRMVDGKQKLIRKLAKRLMPRVKRAEQQRLQSFLKGAPLPEPKQGNMNESEFVNAIFEKKFGGKKTGYVEILGRLDTKKVQSLQKKADKSGVQLETLVRVYERGLESWNESTGLTPDQTAFARVNSFVNEGRTYREDDRDLAEAERSYQVTVRHSRDHGRDDTSVVDVRARNEGDAERRAKKKMSERGEVVHAAEVNEETGMKKGTRVYLKRQTLPNSPHTGTVHSMTDTHVIVKTLGGRYKVPHDNVTTDREQGWMATGRGYRTPVKEDVESIDEVSDELKARYRQQAKFDRVIAKATLKHDREARDAGATNRDEFIKKNEKILDKRDRGLKRLGEETDDKDNGRKSVVNVERGPDAKHPTDPKSSLTRQQEIRRKIIDETKSNVGQRLFGTKSLADIYKRDTPGQVDEVVKAAERAPVVVPSYVDEFGNVIPAKTVMRKLGRKIISSGDVHDGEEK